jgi:hypothetical protein
VASEPCCTCGRRLADASEHHQQVGTVMHRYYRCECGLEWTDHEQLGFERDDAVTSDEVLEVHKQLAKFEGTISELLKL